MTTKLPCEGINPDLLNREIVSFGGKGGTGKTTCAAAAGVYASNHGRKTLVFSMDPAHSLSDIFAQPIGDKEIPIKGVKGLYGFEIDPKRALDDLKREYIPYIDKLLKDLAHRGIERLVLEEIWDLIPPGLDELMALNEINDILKSKEYDLIVVDMPAGAHALRIVNYPEEIDEWFVRVLDLLNSLRKPIYGAPRRIVARHIVPLLELIGKLENLYRDVQEGRKLLADRERLTFVLVTIPEAMGTYVTGDTIEGLKKSGVHNDTIVVNYVIPESVKCDYCASRRKWQRRHIQEIHQIFPERDVVEVPLFHQTIEGMEAITKFAKALFEGEYEPEISVPEIVSEEPHTPRLKFPESVKFLLFGGKGGCGKTTSAAATGIHFTKQGKKVLVASTDPQRSLSDSLNQELPDNKAVPVKGVKNLDALEIDAQKILNEYREKHREAILQLVDGVSELKKEEVRPFIDLSLPGIDEIFGVKKIVDMLNEGKYDLVILDTAPTGHTVHFLELPDVIGRWASFAIKAWNKTKYLMRHFRRGVKYEADLFLEEVLAYAESAKTAFTSPTTLFIPVTTLDEMAIDEAEDLVAMLESFRMPVGPFILNKLVPPNKCPYCAFAFNSQQRMLQEVHEKFPDFEMICMPLFTHEITGTGALKKFAEALYGSAKS